MIKERRSLRILLSAYACEPGRGSEPGVGWNWALALLRRGHEVWVLTRANNRDAIEKALGTLPENISGRVHFIYYDLPRWASWWKKGGRGVQLYYALWQRNVVAAARASHAIHKFDLVHHLTFGVWRQPTHLYKLGVPTIFGPVGGGESAPLTLVRTLPLAAQLMELLRYLANVSGLLNPELRACVQRSQWVIAKTKETAVWLSRAGATCSTFFEIGIDAKRFIPRADGGAEKGLKCLFAGRLIGWKGAHLAIEAVAAARSRGEDISLTVIGKGPMGEKLSSLACDLTLHEHIRFIEWLDQEALFDQYRQHDVLLFPSLHDSSGNVILEAFAHGLPAVCLNLGGPGEIVDSSTGFAVDSSRGAVERLADALCSLSGDPELRSALGRSARDKSLRISWNDVVENIYLKIEQSI